MFRSEIYWIGGVVWFPFVMEQTFIWEEDLTFEEDTFRNGETIIEVKRVYLILTFCSTNFIGFKEVFG